MLILGIIVFGLFVGWLAQLVLGMGSKPDGQTLVAGLAGSFVGGMLASLIAGDGLDLRAERAHRLVRRRGDRAVAIWNAGRPTGP